jgi:hypothetical protein
MSEGFVPCGFRGRRRIQDERLPPGQCLVQDKTRSRETLGRRLPILTKILLSLPAAFCRTRVEDIYYEINRPNCC